MTRLKLLLLFSLLLAFAACTANGDAVDGDNFISDSHGGVSEAVAKSSSSKEVAPIDPTIFGMFNWVKIPKSSITRGGTTFGVNSFSVATTEVTQEVYKSVMDTLPRQSKEGDNRPVSNVSWYRAVLFCNAFSKLAGVDTAYVYESVMGDSILVNLSIDYSVPSVRLPTENEWEIAARGGTTTTYYWDVDVASKYAYYGQSSGPDEVAKKLPNEYGLYDMAGNVAEWVNDWYDSYPKNSSDNYTGPDKGTYRIVRGGGWSDKATEIAPKEREKLTPVHSKATVGFRVVYSTGF